MKREIIKSQGAPQAIGPYSQAVKIGQWIFVSGQIPINPQTGELVLDSVEVQTEIVIENIKNILKEAGASLKDVVKTTLYLNDMSKFDEINRVYGRYFDSNLPARSTVEVAALPKGAGIEVEVIAFKANE